MQTPNTAFPGSQVCEGKGRETTFQVPSVSQTPLTGPTKKETLWTWKIVFSIKKKCASNKWFGAFSGLDSDWIPENESGIEIETWETSKSLYRLAPDRIRAVPKIFTKPPSSQQTIPKANW